MEGEGHEITNAFLKGLLEANQSSQSNDKIQFIVLDNYKDPILTVEAFKNLVDKHNVSAIIGPFLDKNLIAGASSISTTKIPIFAPFKKSFFAVSSKFCLSIFFFVFHNMVLALVVLIFLIGMIINLILRFKRVNIISSYLMIPYLLWCSFALVLNINLIMIN